MKKYIVPMAEKIVLEFKDNISISVLQGYADQNDIARFDIGSMF